MVEWFKAAVLKTAVAQATLGSNPSSSASFVLKSRSKAKSKIASKTCSLLFFLYAQYAHAEKIPQERVIF